MAHKITKVILGNEVTVFWNHRVMRRVDGAGTPYEEANLYVVEVFYNDDGSTIGWTEKEDVFGNDIDELRNSLTWMLECLDKPILDEATLLAQAEAARDNGEEDIFPKERLSLDEVLDSLGLEREDVEGSFERDQIPQWEDDGGGGK